MTSILEKLGDLAETALGEVTDSIHELKRINTKFVDPITKKKTSVKEELGILRGALEKVINEQFRALTREELEYITEAKQVTLSKVRGDPGARVIKALEAVTNLKRVGEEYFTKLLKTQTDSQEAATAIVKSMEMVPSEEFLDRPRLRHFKQIFEHIAKEGISAISADDAVHLYQYVEGDKSENIVDERTRGLPGIYLGQAEHFLKDYGPTLRDIELAHSPGTRQVGQRR